MIQAPFVIRVPREDEFDAWAALYRGYRSFYQFTPDEAIVERVWSWVHDPHHETQALVAVSGEAEMMGLAIYRRFARPSTGSVGVWLDDLFADPQHRNQGIGHSLVDAVVDIAERDGCSIVRWITAADNLTAQRLYDSTSTKTTWVTYERPLGP